MKVCDRCKQPKEGFEGLPILGKKFDVCLDCAKMVQNYIQYSLNKPSFMDRFKKL